MRKENISVDHIGIFVDDMQASIAFYRDNLGGMPGEILELTPTLSIVHLVWGTFDLELIKDKNTVARHHDEMNHVCFHSDNPAETRIRMQKLGLEMEGELQDNDDVTFFFFRGLDGERIEIMRRNR